MTTATEPKPRLRISLPIDARLSPEARAMLEGEIQRQATTLLLEAQIESGEIIQVRDITGAIKRLRSTAGTDRTRVIADWVKRCAFAAVALNVPAYALLTATPIPLIITAVVSIGLTVPAIMLDVRLIRSK